MDINKNNYEAFFLDYYEGNLSAEQVAHLLLFLEQHPEHKEEFESFEDITVADDADLSADFKSQLKKEITDTNREEYFIASVEKQLNRVEEQLLNDYLKSHPQHISEFELFDKTLVTSDSSIIFDAKDSLKKSVIISIEQDRLIEMLEEPLLEHNEQLMLTPTLATEFELYKKTKLNVDADIVYADKETLKRKPARVISMYFYVSAVAASFILLLGLFFLFKEKRGDNLADFESSNKSEQIQNTKIENVVVASNMPVISVSGDNNIQLVQKKSKKSVKKNTEPLFAFKPAILQKLPSIKENSLFPVAQLQVNEIATLNNTKVIIPLNDGMAGPEQAVNSTSQASLKQNAVESLTLTELATERLKENLLDDNTIELQRKTGKLKKVNGWDIAQILSKGVSKLSGQKLEITPKYNKEGDVTSYAVTAGVFQLSKGR